MGFGRIGMHVVAAGGLAAQTVNYTYDAAGRLTSVSYPNGTTITYTYDPAGDLLSRQVVSSAPGASPDGKPKAKKAEAEPFRLAKP
jgi:YD repeat-containing protein